MNCLLFFLVLIPAVPGDRPTTARPPYDPARTTRAVAFWQARVTSDPKGGRGWTELGASQLARHHETGRIADAIEAERSARRAVELRMGGAALTILGRALLAQHRFPEALEVAEKAVRLDPAANKLLCDVLIERGELDRARAAFSRIPTETDPLDRLALEARFQETEAKDDLLIDTLTQLRDLAETMPQIPHELAAWYHVRLGHALIDRGQVDSGRGSCQAALTIVPEDARALVGLAEAEKAEGRWEKALQFAERARKAAPEDFEALQLVAEANQKLGRLEEAQQAYADLRKLADSAPRIYDRHYALVCLESGRDLEEALKRMQADLALRQDPLGYDTIALVYQKLGRKDEARSAITQARKLAPDHPQVAGHAEEILGTSARAATP